MAILVISGCHNSHSSSDNDRNDTEFGGSERFEDWMGAINDKKSIADITIPGTHDSASYKTTMDFHKYSQAQIQSIMLQLKFGIRALDLRVGIDGNMWHGEGTWATNTNVTLDYVLKEMLDFLSQHPHETILATFKQEGPNMVGNTEFSRYLYKKFEEFDLKNFYLEEREFPKMKDIRGKIVVLRRFELGSFDKKMGYYVYWSDKTKGSFHSHNDYKFYAQDWYEVTDDDYDTKAHYFKEAIEHAQNGGEDGRLYLNFMSGEDIPYHFLTTTAQALNNRAESILNNYKGRGKAGVIFINFAADRTITPSLIKIILSVNPEVH